MTLGVSSLLAAAATEVEEGPWRRPAALLLGTAAEALTHALEVDNDPLGQLDALAGIDQAVRTIARSTKAERLAVVREMVDQHGTAYVAAYLDLDESTVRRMAPRGRWQRASTPKGREKQAVELYLSGLPIDAVAKRLAFGHRRVKRVLLAAGVELRVTLDRQPKGGDEGGV